MSQASHKLLFSGNKNYNCDVMIKHIRIFWYHVICVSEHNSSGGIKWVNFNFLFFFLLDAVLAKYRDSTFRIGASPNYRQTQKQKLTYIKNFINFMWDNPQSPPDAHLKYLLDRSKVNAWLSSLNQRLKFSTMKNHILAVTKFCRFLLHAQLACVQLGRRQINGLLLHFKCQLKILSKRMMGHRQQVRDRKVQRMVTTRRRRAAAAFLSSFSEEEEIETQKGHSGPGTSGAVSGGDTGESQASVGESSGVQEVPQTPVTQGDTPCGGKNKLITLTREK